MPPPEGRGTGPRAFRHPQMIRIALWLLIGVALRFALLGADGLWLDEGYTAWTVDLPAERHKVALANDDAPPLYYAAQRVIVPHMPKTEASLRLLSAAAGVAGIAWLAAFPPAAIAVEAPVALLAVGSYGVAYGRQARSYSLLIFLEIVLISATARALQGRKRWLIAVAVAEGLALWTHNVAPTLVVGANVAWLLAGRREARGWIAAQAAAFLIWLPYLIRMASQLRMHSIENGWIVDYWHHYPLALAAPLSLWYMTAGARVWPPPPTRHWSYLGPGAIPISILCVAAILVLLAVSFRRSTRREAIFAASFTLCPLVALEILSFVMSPSYVLGRTDAVAYAGFILWCAIGLRAAGRWIRWGAVGILSLAVLLTLATNFPIGSHVHANDRAIGEKLRAEIHAGDWIAFIGLSRCSIDYYASGRRPGRPDPAIRRLDYPARFGKNPSATYPTPAESLRVWEEEAYRLRERFEREAPADARLFYVGPVKPTAPRDLTAENLIYPGALLAYALNGKRAIDPIARVHGDGLGLDWIAFRVRRDSLISRDELRPVEMTP